MSAQAQKFKIFEKKALCVSVVHAENYTIKLYSFTKGVETGKILSIVKMIFFSKLLELALGCTVQHFKFLEMFSAKINNSKPVSIALILTWHMNVCISLSSTLRLTGSCMLNLGCSTNRKSIFEAVLRYLSLGRLSRLQLQIPIS